LEHQIKAGKSAQLARKGVAVHFLVRPGPLIEMDLVLVRAKYDAGTRRAYVEFRGPEGDAGDAIVAAIFSYKNTEQRSRAGRD
jgi:hypothetical protein